VFHPYFLVGIAVTYLVNGRFDLTENAQIVNVLGQEQALVSGKIIVPDHTFVAPCAHPEFIGDQGMTCYLFAW
jgi:hypothetical protein